ncbi:MAG: hypothetical protein AAF399_18760 [Bacteroidota bacterium]
MHILVANLREKFGSRRGATAIYANITWECVTGEVPSTNLVYLNFHHSSASLSNWQLRDIGSIAPLVGHYLQESPGKEAAVTSFQLVQLGAK